MLHTRQLRFWLFWELDVGKLKPKQLGTFGEDYAYGLFEDAGYHMVNVARGTRRGDLLAVDDNGVITRIEVKSARRGAGGWQFCLSRRVNGRVCTDVKHAEYVLLLAFGATGSPVPFLIPVEALGDRKQIGFHTNPREYAGKWAQYRVNELKLGGLERGND